MVKTNSKMYPSILCNFLIGIQLTGFFNKRVVYM